jgi:hypothetical protein
MLGTKIFSISIVFMVSSLTITSCHRSLEDRAAKEAVEYTRKNCPTPYRNNSRVDSITFDRITKTYVYYYTFKGKLDNPMLLIKNKKKIRVGLLQNLINDPGLKIYKDHGFSFRYLARSFTTGKILLDETYTKKQYLI